MKKRLKLLESLNYQNISKVKEKFFTLKNNVNQTTNNY